jgi:hypothetical protein
MSKHRINVADANALSTASGILSAQKLSLGRLIAIHVLRRESRRDLRTEAQSLVRHALAIAGAAVAVAAILIAVVR